MSEHQTIDRNPNEKRQPWWLWWVAWAFVGFLWILHIGDDIEWSHVMLGLGTGVLLVSWVADIGGLDTPSSWRRKSRRKG